MKSTSARQFRVWMYWLDKQWNSLDGHYSSTKLICNYLVQLTTIVANLFSKQPIKEEKFKIKFMDKAEEGQPRELTEAEKAVITMRAKSYWGTVTGFFNRNKQQPTETKVPK